LFFTRKTKKNFAGNVQKKRKPRSVLHSFCFPQAVDIYEFAGTIFKNIFVALLLF
jgi:hypothetical protein